MADLDDGAQPLDELRGRAHEQWLDDLAWSRAVRARQRREYGAAVGLVAVLFVVTVLVVHLGGGR
jgi:hypothetical protein